MSIFPFAGHRTMAEVAETERLAALRLVHAKGFTKWRRLEVLLTVAEVNNPPPTEPDDAA